MCGTVMVFIAIWDNAILPWLSFRRYVPYLLSIESCEELIESSIFYELYHLDNDLPKIIKEELIWKLPYFISVSHSKWFK